LRLTLTTSDIDKYSGV